MDNVYFKKLPSEVVPSVTNEDDVIICMTRGGGLKISDSSGERTFLDANEAFPVGIVLCRADNISPASFLGGTWQKIAEGQTIIGSNDAYPLNSTGGSADAVVVSHSHIQSNVNTYSSGEQTSFTAGYDIGGSVDEGYAIQFQSTYVAEGRGKMLETLLKGESGVGKNMQPYTAKNYWQRIA